MCFVFVIDNTRILLYNYKGGIRVYLRCKIFSEIVMVAYIIAYSAILLALSGAVVTFCVISMRNSKKAAAAKTVDAIEEGNTFAQVFGGGGDTAFLIIDDDTREPVYVSPNISRYFGLTCDEVKQDIYAVKNKIDKKYVREFTRRFEEWNKTSPLESEFAYGDGGYAMMNAFRAEHGDTAYMAMSFYDITEEKKWRDDMQKQLDCALEQAAAKSSFLSSMSHEIRTPMNGVMGMMSLAKMNIKDTDKAMGYLERAGDLSVFLLSMINDILDISKIESGKMQLFFSPLDIMAFADKIRNMFTGTITGKGINFKVETVDFTSRYLIGDEMRLTQVVTNLVSNASKFTPAGGKIAVTFKQLDNIGGKVQLMIRVRDTGKGIAPENIRKIMRPFEQEEASTAHNYGGTGLGLAICDNIVRLMGGNIVIDSTLGKGTDFSVFVALDVADTKPEPSAGSAISQLSPDALEDYEYDGCRILLAEDNEVNAEIAVEILESDGAVVTLAKDGREAVDIFMAAAENSFDLLLFDIQMPRMNGRQAAQAVRESGRKDAMSVPIIALSADAFIEDVKLSEAAGMDAHVSKPVDFDELRKRAGEVINIKKSKFADSGKK